MAELAHLRALAKRYPDVSDVLAEQSNLEAILALPKMSVHVVSDVHGEFAKLRQVINNASGSLRPFLEQLFAGQLSSTEIGELLGWFYYPRETWLAVGGPTNTLTFVERAATTIVALAKRYTIKHLERIIPDPYDPVIRELVFARELERAPGYVERLIAPFQRHPGRTLELVRTLARIVRNLSVGELVVAGDLGDRGPRIDKVIEILEEQPNVAITWGNHDADWIAACLGHPAAIATVVRLSLRYQRLAQLEEGYGISLAPLADLARSVYADDPATRFAVKGEPGSDPGLLARMQKAIAIIQFKLEGALFRAHPEWRLEHRALLHRIDPKAGTIALDGKTYPLGDTRFPTIDWQEPYSMSREERVCINTLCQAFVSSSTLWRQINFVASHGSMYLCRDRCAIFHGCMPVDAAGNFLEFSVDDVPRKGKALFDAIEVAVQRAVRRRALADMDLVFYLWTGPLSPCFGKDKMATFETYFLDDKSTHEEVKNPYFKLIHDAAFCAKVLKEFGVAEDGFLVNGHVPVKLEQGEQPIKKSGRAITIDGAFAAAYGDKGFTLVLDPHRMYLAQHHHYDGAEATVARGEDIVPTVTDVEVYAQARTVGDTEKGSELRAEIAALDELVQAFETNTIRARGGNR